MKSSICLPERLRHPDSWRKIPWDRIPVLELEDGTCLIESNAIVFWLCQGSTLLPPDPLSLARVVQWMCFEQSNIDKVLGRTRFLRRYPEFMATTRSQWDQWYAEGRRALGVLESRLRDAPFLVGDGYAAADICLYGYVHCAEEGGFDLAGYAAVRRWLEAVARQSGYVPIDRIGKRFPPVPDNPETGQR